MIGKMTIPFFVDWFISMYLVKGEKRQGLRQNPNNKDYVNLKAFRKRSLKLQNMVCSKRTRRSSVITGIVEDLHSKK